MYARDVARCGLLLSSLVIVSTEQYIPLPIKEILTTPLLRHTPSVKDTFVLTSSMVEMKYGRLMIIKGCTNCAYEWFRTGYLYNLGGSVLIANSLHSLYAISKPDQKLISFMASRSITLGVLILDSVVEEIDCPGNLFPLGVGIKLVSKIYRMAGLKNPLILLNKINKILSF
jgi:hypothetical protein